MNMGNGGVVSLLKYIISILENDFKMGNEDDFKKLLEILNNLNNKTTGDINTLNQAVSNLINNLGTDLSSEISNISTVLQSLINNGDWGLSVIAQLLKNPTYGLSKIIEAITTNKLLLTNSNYGLNGLLNAITTNKNLLNNSTYGLNALLNAINNMSGGFAHIKNIDIELNADNAVNGFLTHVFHSGSRFKCLPRVAPSSSGAIADFYNICIDHIGDLFYPPENRGDGYMLQYNNTYFEGNSHISVSAHISDACGTGALFWFTGLVYYN